jgi:hypothetical protein
MTYYSNQDSLEAAFGVDEVTGLLGDDPDVRLEKAAKAAFDDINAYLKTAGYLLPLIFTSFGRVPPTDGPALLNGRVQDISDVFTAWYLAKHTDLAKKVYEDGRTDGLKWLDALVANAVRVDLPKTTELTGSGELVVKARGRIFNKNMKAENELFGQR